MIQVGAKRRLDPQVAVGQRPELGVGLEQCLEMPPRLLGLRAHPGVAFCPFHRGGEPRDRPRSASPTQARGQGEQGPPGYQTFA